MAVNEWGIIQEREVIQFGTPRQTKKSFDGSATVEIGEHDGLFYWSCSFDLIDQGGGFSPGPGDLDHYIGDFRKGFPTREAAEARAIAQLKERLARIAGGDRENATAVAQAKRLLEEVDGRRQLILF